MKKHYLCPISLDFGAGSIAEIYQNYKNRENFQGRARLLKEIDCIASPQERLYIRKQIGSGRKQEPHTIIWSWKRWKVEFIDGPNKGWITARKIAFFVAINNKYTSKN